jgi:2-oxoglutarate ferredoxin oxidoreductase subunit beta
VWVVTGDGDALSIGGNHLIHALRRNVNLKILLFNNRIYGLTKGQYSPTSELGKITKSTPMGSLDNPFNPISVALGAEATFVARTLDSDRKHLQSVLREAASHQGTALIEIYQNCNIFNDGAFDAIKDASTRDEWAIPLVDGEPIRFGSSKAVVRLPDGSLAIEDDVAADDPRVVVHDAHRQDPSYAFALSRLQALDSRYAPMGVFRSVERATYDTLMADQLDAAAAKSPGDDGALQNLLKGADTWQVA